MKKFGLIGFPLTHSFSKKYYLEKFRKERIADAAYELYPIEAIEELPFLLQSEALAGINVTIPYKIAVMKYLDSISPEAEAVEAVNCIRIEDDGRGEKKLTGYNTDVFGFEKSLKPLLKPQHRKALVLGTGGAAKAVVYTLSQLGIAYKMVSRTPRTDFLAYKELTAEIIQTHTLIINTTPLGTYPDVDGCPDIPYGHINAGHLLYDLVYNPAVTAFLKKGGLQGATVKNGMEMLELQAEKNWEIWNY